jgi:4-hydroxy-2-oxoheptanedioate aldolase
MRRARHTLDDLLAKPGRVLGTWTQIPHGDLIDALGAAGYEFTIIDCEHGAFGIETAQELIRACEAAGVTPLVRVPRGDWTALYKALDAGAAGVLVPSIESPAEAAQAVATARFAPQGDRGACPIVRAADHAVLPWQDFAARQSGCGVVAMIETRAGLAAAEAICQVPGLKAVLLGPFDLSVSMGLAGHVSHPDVQAGLLQIIAAARAAKLPVWMPVFSTDEAVLAADIARWQAEGIQCFAIGADKIIVSAALARYRQVAAGAAATTLSP